MSVLCYICLSQIIIIYTVSKFRGIQMTGVYHNCSIGIKSEEIGMLGVIQFTL